MDGIRHEVMAERVHLHQGRHSRAVAEVVAVLSTRQRGARCRLRTPHDGLFPVCQVLSDEWECKASKVAPASCAADDDVGVVIDFGELLECFFSNYGLMQEDVVEHLHGIRHTTGRSRNGVTYTAECVVCR